MLAPLPPATPRPSPRASARQSATVIMTTAGAARRMGVPAARLVFLHGCADTVEAELLRRPALHRSPAMQVGLGGTRWD
jgi:hypothetical protein